MSNDSRGVHIIKTLTESGAVSTVPITVSSIVCTVSSDASSVALANQATAGGTAVVTLKATTNVLTARTAYPRGSVYSTACYATITGTTPTVTITYKPL